MLKSHITNNNIDPVYTLPDPYDHDINFNSFKTRVDFQLKMILQNLIKTSHRKGGWSKYDRKHPELDVVTSRIGPCKRGHNHCIHRLEDCFFAVNLAFQTFNDLINSGKCNAWFKRRFPRVFNKKKIQAFAV